MQSETKWTRGCLTGEEIANGREKRRLHKDGEEGDRGYGEVEGHEEQGRGGGNEGHGGREEWGGREIGRSNIRREGMGRRDT